MESIVAISSVEINEVPFACFWDQRVLTRRTTSEATVDLPAPGGPARPTMYLLFNIKVIQEMFSTEELAQFI